MSEALRRFVLALAFFPVAAAPALAQAPAVVGLQGFGIVLVLGDVQDGATSDNMPAAARAALADLKDFLPYRSYRVLDSAWVLASSTTRQALTSRLRGPEEQDYEVVLDRLALPPSSLQIRFTMREPGLGVYSEQKADRDGPLRGEIQQMIAARAALENRLRQPGADPAAISVLRQQLIDAETAIETRHNQLRSSSGAPTLIDTTFSMALGETVVVGTSRMRGGNKALIVLLTAATRGAKPRE